MESINYNKENGAANVELVMFHLKKADKAKSVDDMRYREIYFRKNIDGSWEYFFKTVVDEKEFGLEDHELKEYTNFHNDINEWYKGPKIDGKNEIITHGYKFDPEGNTTYGFLYRFIKRNYLSQK